MEFSSIFAATEQYSANAFVELYVQYSEGLIVYTMHAAVSFLNQICILNCLRCILYRIGVKWKERLMHGYVGKCLF